MELPACELETEHLFIPHPNPITLTYKEIRNSCPDLLDRLYSRAHTDNPVLLQLEDIFGLEMTLLYAQSDGTTDAQKLCERFAVYCALRGKNIGMRLRYDSDIGLIAWFGTYRQ